MSHLPTYLPSLAALGVHHQFRKAAIILNEGDKGDALYLLLSGSARSFTASSSGKILSYNTISSGQYFGEMALDGGKRSASVQAVTDCECVLVPNAQVLLYAREHPDFAADLLQTVIHRARLATDSAKSMALSDVYERLWKVMHQEFDDYQGICTLTHAQMAAQIGASREMVSKLIKDLVRGGYVAALRRREIKQLKKIPLHW
jgi:CRP/FNR family cyclic AMP-dependent transcriptional regulator